MKSLKEAKTLKDVAGLLGFQASTLSFVLFKLPDDVKYKTFEIPKKSGGVRIIKAPVDRIKTLQKNLARLLEKCRSEIDKEAARPSLSHGFRTAHSIYTNARSHKKRRYVLNLDLEDFFGTINFGRVRGYFNKNRDFELDEKIATIIAQIACHQNSLPQGSPCSPIISDLIGHLLDVKLAQLAKVHKCTYSRYADDLTFSTNRKEFPVELASRPPAPGSEWVLGAQLLKVITDAGFAVNNAKTRMQCAGRRQLVTGLTVNAKVNIRADQYKTARAMCNSLFQKGEFNLPGHDKPASIAVLEGILSHIHFIKDRSDHRDSAEKKKKASSFRKLYKKFLFYKYFVALDRPIIVGEGKTDSIYLKLAMKKLATLNPKIAVTDGKVLQSKIKFFNSTNRVHEVMQLGGGSSDLLFLIRDYKEMMDQFKTPKNAHPVIVLVDNDSGASKIFSIIKEKFKFEIKHTSTADYYHLCHNLYLIKSPEIGPLGISCIENLFDESLLTTTVEGKTFNLHKKHAAPNEYGKLVFAEKVIRPHAATIDFSKFSQVFERIVGAIDDYEKRKNAFVGDKL